MNEPEAVTKQPTIIEIDYWAREQNGMRYHQRVVRMEVPDGTPEIELPFLLTRKVGKHHGIIKMRVVHA